MVGLLYRTQKLLMLFLENSTTCEEPSWDPAKLVCARVRNTVRRPFAISLTDVKFATNQSFSFTRQFCCIDASLFHVRKFNLRACYGERLHCRIWCLARVAFSERTQGFYFWATIRRMFICLLMIFMYVCMYSV